MAGIGESLREYFRPTGEVRKRDVLREFMNQGGLLPGVEETVRALPRQAARFAISAAETPRALRRGEASGEWYDTPFGRINSFQSEAQNRVRRGDPLWKAIGNPALDTLLAASDIAPVATIGARSLQGVSPLARDFLRPLGRTAQFESPLLQRAMRPGLSLMEEGDPAWYRDILRGLAQKNGPPTRHSFTGEPRKLTLSDLFEIQAERGAAERALSAPKRPDPIQAIGIPKIGGNRAQAITPKGVPPEIMPKTGYGRVGNRLFQGGINSGRYDQGNATYVLDAMDGGNYKMPDPNEIAAAVRDRSRVILDVPTEDVGPISPVTAGIAKFLESHGYVEVAPGIWHPSRPDLRQWLFKNVGAKKPARIAEQPIPEMTDDARILFDKESGAPFIKSGKDYYGENFILNDGIPMFHKPVKKPHHKASY